MLKRFTDYVREQRLFAQGERVLLAVSGGRDSVSLVRLMADAGYRFGIAHCNFHLRPGDCDRDERFVRRLAADLEVPVHVAGFDTAAAAAERHQSIEEAARELRYTYFAGLCRSEGYDLLATAHHRDDSAETFFLNLLRGTGVAGLCGIRPLSCFATAQGIMRVAHPMLCFSRADIDRYVAACGLAYVEDATNYELDAMRNRVRHRLMPLLRELSPAVDGVMQGNMARLAEAGQVVEKYVGELRERLCRRVEPRLPWLRIPIDAFEVDSLRSLTPARMLLFELLRPYGFNAAVAESVVAALSSAATGSRFLSATHEAVFDRGRLLVAPVLPPEAPSIATEPSVLPAHCPASATTVYVAPEAVRLPLALRPWHEGDRFRPFGMTGMRLVSDYLKDEKISVIEKRHVWLLTDADDRVVWVVGLRADERTRVAAVGEPCLKVALQL